jgi:hypothetical protein
MVAADKGVLTMKTETNVETVPHNDVEVDSVGGGYTYCEGYWGA